MKRFEEHDGKLWLMLEQPVPLTEDAKFPCVVRLIQDDSPMGRYNKSYSEYRYGVRLGCCMLPIIATHIAKNGVVNDIEWDVSRYEIIGTLVAEGSAEWGEYQTQQGVVVRHKYGCVVRPEYDNSSRAAIFEHYPTGWQIYKEPKEEPQPAKEPIANCENCKHVCTNSNIDHCYMYEPKPEPEHMFAIGDKVTDGVIEGTIIHIEDAIVDVCPSTDEYKIELCNLNHIPESPKQDDVEKPLRSMIAEAKAIGKNIRTYYQDIVFTPQALEACLNQGKFRWWSLENWELTDRKQNMQPESEPQADLPIADEPQAVKPSEIIVKITLEGTVRPGINESCFEISTPNGGWATIGKDEITADELELVESLLKAQEESCT